MPPVVRREVGCHSRVAARAQARGRACVRGLMNAATEKSGERSWLFGGHARGDTGREGDTAFGGLRKERPRCANEGTAEAKGKLPTKEADHPVLPELPEETGDGRLTERRRRDEETGLPRGWPKPRKPAATAPEGALRLALGPMEGRRRRAEARRQPLSCGDSPPPPPAAPTRARGFGGQRPPSQGAKRQRRGGAQAGHLRPLSAGVASAASRKRAPPRPLSCGRGRREQRRPRLPKSEAGSRGIPRRCRRPGRAGDPPRRFLGAMLKIVVGLS